MKKTILLGLICGCSFITIAQNKSLFPAANKFMNKAVTCSPPVNVNDKTIPLKTPNATTSVVKRNAGGDNNVNFLPSEHIIGNTDFDLQTNSSSYPRIVKNADGTICAMWAFYPDGGTTTAKGAAYNYFDGSTWGPYPIGSIAPPGKNIGFPNCVVTASAHEACFASSTDSAIAIVQRPVKGTGPWSFNSTDLKTNGNGNTDTWARAVSGGSNDLSIHCIANDLSEPPNGNIIYSRSTDDGVTWNILRTSIPGMDPIAYPYYIAGDAYCIATHGDTVAIVLGYLTTDIALFKSTDNGTTWTKTQITNQWAGGSYNPDGNISDINADGIADTVITTGGDVNVTIDNNGICHVFWGVMKMCDDNDTIGVKTFETFPATNGISYWHEGMTVPVVITGAIDWNLNGIIDIPIYVPAPGELGFGRYGNMGLSCVPSAAVDTNNDIYLTFMALNEVSDSTLYFKIHYQVYVVYSADGGITWSLPYNIITAGLNVDSSFFEGAYPSIAKRIDMSLYIQYQRDYVPGIFWGSIAGSIDEANNDPLNNVNEIVVTDIPFNIVNGIVANASSFAVSQNSPNPADGTTAININIATTADVKVEVTTLTGQILFTNEQKKIPPGMHTINLNTSHYAPGIYFYSVTIEGEKISKKMIVR